jgi:hypothetical protein
MKPTREQIDYVTKRFVDQGKLIEAGWVTLRFMTIPDDAPEVQVTEMRRAYFAGCQHLFASIMLILEPGAEPTEKDLKRMGLIRAELDAFVAQLEQESNGGWRNRR